MYILVIFKKVNTPNQPQLKEKKIYKISNHPRSLPLKAPSHYLQERYLI